MKKLVMFGALALSMLSLTAVAEDAKPIRIGIEAGYPPFSMKPLTANSPVSMWTSAMRCASR
jgi:ABC-type amino acid transport substrate-binding protein